MPRICGQQKARVEANELPFWQRDLYGCAEWYESWQGRNRVEGVFGNLKNEAAQAVRRGHFRVMGLAKTVLMAMFFVMAANLRLADTFELAQAAKAPTAATQQTDPSTPTTPSTSDRTTSHRRRTARPTTGRRPAHRQPRQHRTPHHRSPRPARTPAAGASACPETGVRSQATPPRRVTASEAVPAP